MKSLADCNDLKCPNNAGSEQIQTEWNTKNGKCGQASSLADFMRN